MHTYKVLICGGMSTGKSSLLKRFIEKIFPNNIESSKSLDFYIQDLIIDEEKMTVQFWDMGGEDYPKELLQGYAEGTSGVMITYDSTNSITLEKSNWWLNILSEMLPLNIPYLLVGCKSDLTHIEDFISYPSSPSHTRTPLIDDVKIPSPDLSPTPLTDNGSSSTTTSGKNSLTPNTNPYPDSLDNNNKVILLPGISETLAQNGIQQKLNTIDKSAFTKKDDVKALITNYPNLKLDYIETSAFSGFNVEEAFELLAKSIKRAEYKFSYL